MSECGHWWPAYVGIGSNLGIPTQQIMQAIELLDEIPGSRLIDCSSLYRSAPFGGIEQPDFVNAVAALLTTLDARSLLTHLLDLEKRQGRERGGARWGPRVLDLDLLVFGNTVFDEPGLTIPHPGIAEMVRRAQEAAPGKVALAMGGFHLGGADQWQIKDIIAELRRLGVRRVAPCHCSGERARRMLAVAFGPNCTLPGVGWGTRMGSSE